MKTSAIFIILLCLISYTYSQQAFKHINTLLNKFKQSNINEQKDAEIREKIERRWCDVNVGKTHKELGRRTGFVNKLFDQINSLEKKITEHRADVKERKTRIEGNHALLEKFKQQRCDNNLLFVKNLRDHMEAVDVLKLLRTDIVKYFNKKNKQISLIETTSTANGTNIEKDDSLAQTKINLVKKISKLGEFANLLDVGNKNLFMELTKFGDDVKKQSDDVHDITKTKERSAKQIGRKHIDNTKDELKSLETPSFDSSSDFNKKSRKRVLRMIDALIKHLKESRDRITRDEIKASEDFAVFHKNLHKENTHFQRTIEGIQKKIADRKIELLKANKDLLRKKKLRNQTKRKLGALESLCKNKYIYFEKETKRRTKEIKIIERARAVFKKILEKAAVSRAARRTSAIASGKTIKEKDKESDKVAELEKKLTGSSLIELKK